MGGWSLRASYEVEAGGVTPCSASKILVNCSMVVRSARCRPARVTTSGSGTGRSVSRRAVRAYRCRAWAFLGVEVWADARPGWLFLQSTGGHGSGLGGAGAVLGRDPGRRRVGRTDPVRRMDSLTGPGSRRRRQQADAHRGSPADLTLNEHACERRFGWREFAMRTAACRPRPSGQAGPSAFGGSPVPA